MVNENKKACIVVNKDGNTLITMKGLRAEGDKLVLRGALLGQWDTDMYVTIDSIKALIGLVDFKEILGFLNENILKMTIDDKGL
ncbi:MAG: hypothetical protein J5804_00525 [Eggerthellaceae bacterium]|nr:hypothetical protein [Eggerthellaceae bacterium]